MIRYFVFFFMLFSVPLAASSVFGTVEDFTTDKTLYHDGDLIAISGTVSYDSSYPSVTIQILNPSKSDFAGIGFAFVDSDGSFSSNIRAGGAKWSDSGVYTIKVTYDDTLEKSIEYEASTPEPDPVPSTPDPDPAPSTPDPDPVPSTPDPDPAPSTPDPDPAPSTPEPIELEIPASFVDESKDPQIYVDRYNNETIYKEWFDANYSQYASIYHAVGLEEPKELASFVDSTVDPQSYVDRYNTDPTYKEWFDTYYSRYSSIYEAVGLKEPASVPTWIRNNAGWWATDAINDSTFVTGIEFLLENNIITISNVSSSGDVSDGQIPEWIKNTAGWWADGAISEDEFLSSLKFLIQEGIITVN